MSIRLTYQSRAVITILASPSVNLKLSNHRCNIAVRIDHNTCYRMKALLSSV